MALDIGGAIVELDTLRKYRQQIEKGALTRDLEVTVYRRNQRDKVIAAGAIPELWPIFDDVLGPLQAEPAAGATEAEQSDPQAPGAEPDVDEAPVIDTIETPPSTPEEPLPTELPGIEQRAPGPETETIATPKNGGGVASIAVDDNKAAGAKPPMPPVETHVDRTPEPGPKGLGAIVSVVVVILGVAGLIARCGGPAPQSLETDYATRVTKVRREPTAAGSNEVGDVARGETLVGRLVKGADGQSRWLQLTDGRWKGDYVWMDNLSRDPRPALTAVDHRFRRLLTASAATSLPNSPLTLRAFGRGDAVMVLGTTADGWREIELTGGGVGYLPPAAFGEGGASQSPSPNPAEGQPSPKPQPVAAAAPLMSKPEKKRLKVILAAPKPVVAPYQALPPPPPPRPVQAPPPPSGPQYVTNPAWIRRPSGAERDRYMPQRAMDQGQNGRAVIDCAINGSGLLVNCTVQEDPQGWGFGQAALALGRLYQAGPTTPDGQPTAGARVKIPFRFQFDQ